MANPILIKRSSVAAKVPATTDLALGELAINTVDGKLFLKKNVSGTETIVQVGPLSTTDLVEGSNLYFTAARAQTAVTTITGNAGTATTLATARNINGVSFNGSADITVTAAASTLSGATLNSTVTASSLTSVGTLGALTVTNAVTAGSFVSGNITVSGDTILSSNPTITIDPSTAGAGGLVVIAGNLQVTGTTTTINSTTVTTSDLNIEVAKDAINAAAASGAGITVNAAFANATLTYSNTTDSWDMNKSLSATLRTAAQPNITSVGTLASLAVTGAVTGASFNSITGLSAVAGAALGTAAAGTATAAARADHVHPLQTTITGNAGTATTLATARLINGVSFNGSADITVAAAAGTLTGATLNSTVTASSLTSVGTLNTLTVSGAITVPSITKSGTTGTGDIGQSTNTFGTVYATVFSGVSTTAKYADLAENYAADATYAPGTVVMFGGEQEVTLGTADTQAVAGVITTNPAHLMNSDIVAEFAAAVALQGRVPCRVIGAVAKGDLMVSAGNGFAMANNDAKIGQVIGKALGTNAGGEGVIEVVVGRV